jgi:hypothetical protein
MKKCSKCGQVKDAAEFYKRKDRPTLLVSQCKSCRREDSKNRRKPKQQRKYKLKILYGLTEEDYERMLKEQDGVCGICKKEEAAKSNTGYTKNLAVDHCHHTGKIRGLLCHNCNIAIGKLKDDVSLLESALKYLKEKL